MLKRYTLATLLQNGNPNRGKEAATQHSLVHRFKRTGRYNYERSNQELLKEEVKRLNNVMLSFFSLSSSWMRPCATKVHAAINCLGKGYIDKNLHKVFSQLFGSERAT